MRNLESSSSAQLREVNVSTSNIPTVVIPALENIKRCMDDSRVVDGCEGAANEAKKLRQAIRGGNSSSEPVIDQINRAMNLPAEDIELLETFLPNAFDDDKRANKTA